MNITHNDLIRLGACSDARDAFIARFGADATVTAQDVFRALADLERANWLQWLCNAAPEFPAAVGNCEAAHGWQSIVVGAHDAQAGIWLASGSATVRAYDSATVEASGSATVRAYDSATVRASGSATVEASDSATVEASGSATVEAYGSATVRAYGSATVEAYGSATVRAYGSATVRAYDSATVLTQYFADGVSTILHGDMSCWIDRRAGLKIITAATQATLPDRYTTTLEDALRWRAHIDASGHDPDTWRYPA